MVKTVYRLDIEPLLLTENSSYTDPPCLTSIREMLSKWGILVIQNHGVNLSLLDECYRLSQEFFALPQKNKERLNYKSLDQKLYSDVGYFPFRTETAVGSAQPDLKEFFRVGVTPEESQKHLFAQNAWPADLPEFRPAFLELFTQFTHCGDKILRWLASAFDLSVPYFEELSKNGTHVLRSIHYPPVAVGADGMRAAPHTGIQLLGIQPRTTHPGLEYKTPAGEWFALDADEFRDCVLINIGDMLSYLLGGEAEASLHRVVNAEGIADHAHRYCIVFFYHAHPEQELLKHSDQSSSTGLIAGEWLNKRFKEIGIF